MTLSGLRWRLGEGLNGRVRLVPAAVDGAVAGYPACSCADPAYTPASRAG